MCHSLYVDDRDSEGNPGVGPRKRRYSVLGRLSSPTSLTPGP